LKKQLSFITFTFLLSFLCFKPCYAEVFQHEHILSYNSLIQVKKNSILVVEETIEAYAAGDQIKRGIYRDFPTKYKRENGRDVVVGFEVIAVTKNGQKEPYHVKNHANGKRVYIGHPDHYLKKGKYTYVLTYETTRQLGFFEDHDELYWNVTGNDWDFVIDKASASVRLPEAVPASRITAEAYTGSFGSKERSGGEWWRVVSLP